MSLLKKTRREFSWVGVASIGLLVLACSTDSPTAPEQVPAPLPGGGSGTTWTITLSVDPSSQTAGNSQPSTITIRVRRAGGGGAPANGTTAVVTTSLGDFGSLGSGSRSAVVALINGLAQLLFFPGDVLGDALLTARLEGSVGQIFVSIRALDTLFISALSPITGPEIGGTRVRIEGTGFVEPLTVSVGDFLATVVSVGSKGLVIKVDTPRIFDPGAFFNTEACDADGDGEEDGERRLPTSVSVTVTLRSGTVATATVPNGFTYFPADSRCVEPVDPPPPPAEEVNASFSIEPEATPCPVTCTVIFTNTSTGDPTSFSWDFDVFSIGSASPATSTQENPVVNFLAAGTYTVTLTASKAGSSDTVSQFVTVVP